MRKASHNTNPLHNGKPLREMPLQTIEVWHRVEHPVPWACEPGCLDLSPNFPRSKKNLRMVLHQKKGPGHLRTAPWTRQR